MQFGPNSTPEEIENALRRSAQERYGADRAAALDGRLKNTARWTALIGAAPVDFATDPPDQVGLDGGSLSIPRHDLPITDVASRIRERELSATDMVRSHFERIDHLDPQVQAWVVLDRERALQRANELDVRAGRGEFLPLHGVPFGVKDIIDVAGLPTGAGFPPYRDRTAEKDAAVVARLRALGAIPLGKTHTTQFAFSDPAPTTNPYDLTRTPGGSSSGSAAAVSAQMVPLALGTQTAGSVLRPAAYCGVVGFKPTYNWFSRDGVLPLAWSLDHLGLLTGNVADAALVYGALLGIDVATAHRPVPPRIGFVQDFLERSAPDVAEHLNSVRGELVTAGATVTSIKLPLDLDLLLAVHHLIMQIEVASVHGEQVARMRDSYGPAVPADTDVGQLVPATYDVKARRLRGSLGRIIDTLFEEYDALILPTASNVAPARALGSTGDRTFQAPGSLLGLPAISLPLGIGTDSMPIGTQLIGRRGDDARLLSLAAWVEAAIGLIPPPSFE
ncbi:MAG TPA: amidase [Nitrolancea sp.]|nr:amidase [Nitrolancea sp.]